MVQVLTFAMSTGVARQIIELPKGVCWMSNHITPHFYSNVPISMYGHVTMIMRGIVITHPAYQKDLKFQKWGVLDL